MYKREREPTQKELGTHSGSHPRTPRLPAPTPHHTTVTSSAFMSAFTAGLTGLVAFTMAKVWPDKVGAVGAVSFAAVVAFAQMCSGLCAGLLGSTLPLYFAREGIDPATACGPGETALQDSIGTTLLFALARGLLGAGAR